MRELIIEEPYEFVPPYRGRLWLRLLRPFVPIFLRRAYGVERVEWRGVEHLQESIDVGHGILLAPNHCRPCDPVVMTCLAGLVRQPFYIMASWHLFKQALWRREFIRRMGAFSVYREGMDRTAVSYAVKVLESAERPLVIFPEGVITRSNGMLRDLMAGTTFIARSAARKRAKAADGKVVIHPIATFYRFHGDLAATLNPVLSEIEERLTWRPQTDLSLFDRIYKVGTALLGLKEKEYLGETREGPLNERIERLSNAILEPLEEEYVEGEHDGDVVARVKRLRIAIVPVMTEGEITPQERERCWLQLDAMALTQQMACFPPDYLAGSMVAERYLETVERFEEDLTGSARIHRPMSAVVQVGRALEVSSDRPRKGEPDALLGHLDAVLEEMIAALAEEAHSLDPLRSPGQKGGRQDDIRAAAQRKGSRGSSEAAVARPARGSRNRRPRRLVRQPNADWADGLP